jgi:integrase
MVAVPQRITGTKRDRNFFSDLSEAHKYIGDVYLHGYLNAEKIRFNGSDLVASAQPSTGDVNRWIEKFLRELLDRGKIPTWKRARSILHHFGRRLGRRPINSITRDDLLDWQNTIEGTYKTKHNHQRYVRWFFRWCIDEAEPSPIGRNPMAKIKRFEPEHSDPILLTSEQFGACLQYAKDNNEIQLLAWLCLGGFHGIRTEEILRMDWSHLDWKNGYIHVLQPKKVRGWKPRHLKMRDGVRRHLEGLIFPGHEIVPGKNSNVKQVRFNRRRKLMLQNAGITAWPRNTLRHSFKSYDEALNDGHAQTQHEMGHSNPNMTRYGYGTDTAGGFFVTKESAEKWFAV